MRCFYLTVLAIAIACTSSLSAADITWTGATSLDWTVAGNWSGAVPGTGDVAVFDGSGTVNVTDATDVGGIKLVGESGLTVNITTTVNLTIGSADGFSLRTVDGNSLSVDSGANSVAVESHIFADNGNITVFGDDVRLGTQTATGNGATIRQHNGNLVFGDTTCVAPSTSATADESNDLNFERTTGGSGTIQFAKLTVQSDNGGSANDNNVEVGFSNLKMTILGTFELLIAQASATGGAEVYMENCNLTYRGDILISASGAGAVQGPELHVEDSTLTADASGVDIIIEAEGIFTSLNSTLTGSSSVGSYWTFNARTGCDTVALVDSTITSYQADRLAILLSGSNTTFEFGLVVTGSTFSNYDSAGVRILSGSYLAAFNDNTFLTGQAGGTHIDFEGALDAGSVATFDNNKFDNSTLGTTGSLVVNNGATREFRAISGSDFGSGVTTNAGTADGETTNATGTITWTDGGIALGVATASNSALPTGFAIGLAADDTADQVFAEFDLTAMGDDILITALDLTIEMDDQGGSFSVATDVSGIKLFVDANDNGVLDGGETTYDGTVTNDEDWAFSPAETISNGNAVTWGLAVTFNASIVGKSARVSMMVMPALGTGSGPFTMTDTTPAAVEILTGLPIFSNDIPVSGVAAEAYIIRSANGGTSGNQLSVMPMIGLRDVHFKEVLTDNSTNVVVSINSGTGSITGTLTVQAVNGVVTFSDVVINGAGLFILEYIFGSTTIVGNPFMIVALPPEIDIQNSVAAVSIADGTGTDALGSIVVSSSGTVTYVIENTGAGNLDVTDIRITSTTNCVPTLSTTTPATSFPLSNGAAHNVIIDLHISSAAAFNFTFEVDSNDVDEATYDFVVSGTGVEPTIEVLEGSNVLNTGNSHTINGVTDGVERTVTYTIVNTGTSPLTLGTIAVLSSNSNITGTPTISVTPTSPVAANGGTTTFEVKFTATTGGTFRIDLEIPNDDPLFGTNANYDMIINGTATAAPEPEIDILRNGTSIVSNTSDAIVNDLLVGSDSTFTYTVENTGSADLTISSTAITGTPGNCTASISTAPAGTVTALGSTTFVVTVNPTTAAAWDCEVTVTNNDSDEGTYVVTLTGNAASSVPEIGIKRGSTSIAAGDTDSVGTTLVLTYTVENTGGAILTYAGNSASISAETGCTVSVTTAPSATVAASGTDTLTVTVVASGGAFSFDILVESDDADESSYVIHVSGNTVTSGGGDDDDGCAASSTGSNVLWLLLALMLVPAVLRRRNRA